MAKQTHQFWLVFSPLRTGQTRPFSDKQPDQPSRSQTSGPGDAVSDYQVSDPIKEYQELSAIIEARYAPEFKVVEVPTALSGESKSLQGDDYPLTYDANGYPELPACLDRRPKPPLAKAA